ISDALLAHRVAQRLDARIGVLRLARVLSVTEAIVPAGEPRVLINDCREPLGGLVIGPLPQGAEGARRADDRQIADAVGGGDFGELVGHARAASDSRYEPLGALENSVEDALRAAHLPQHIDVDRPLPGGDLIGALHMRNRAVDRILDQLFVTIATSERLVNLRDDAAFRIIAVGIDCADRPDAASSGPGARARVIGRGDALAAFDQRPDFAPSIEDGLEALEQITSPR